MAIVLARMGSSRLPGKTLMKIAGKPSLQHLLERLSGSLEVDEVIVATTDLAEDDDIQILANTLGYRCFRGSAQDVLSRVAGASAWAEADLISYVTGDCIVICPEVVDLAVQTFQSAGCDYLSNLIVQTYPQAVDTRVFRARAIQLIDRELAGDDAVVREHAYLYFEEHPERFKIFNMEAPPHHRRPEWRLDLDYEVDLRLLRRVFADLEPVAPRFGLDRLIEYLDSHPELRAINEGMTRKPQR